MNLMIVMTITTMEITLLYNRTTMVLRQKIITKSQQRLPLLHEEQDPPLITLQQRLQLDNLRAE